MPQKHQKILEQSRVDLFPFFGGNAEFTKKITKSRIFGRYGSAGSGMLFAFFALETFIPLVRHHQKENKGVILAPEDLAGVVALATKPGKPSDKRHMERRVNGTRRREVNSSGCEDFNTAETNKERRSAGSKRGVNGYKAAEVFRSSLELSRSKPWCCPKRNQERVEVLAWQPTGVRERAQG